jgi:hypothetical protein
MTKDELYRLFIERKRLAAAYNSLISSRNIIIDMLDKEYLRHVKLTQKKDEPIAALITSLSKSRNIKKFQRELLDIKNRLKENQAQAKRLKDFYKVSKFQYDVNITNLIINYNWTA